MKLCATHGGRQSFTPFSLNITAIWNKNGKVLTISAHKKIDISKVTKCDDIILGNQPNQS
jgi:hypothetical protein